MSNLVIRIDEPVAFLLRGETTWTELQLDCLAALLQQVGERRLWVFLPTEAVHRLHCRPSPLGLMALWWRLSVLPLIRARHSAWGWCLLGRDGWRLRLMAAAVSRRRLQSLLQPLQSSGARVVRAIPPPQPGIGWSTVTGWPPGGRHLPNLMPKPLLPLYTGVFGVLALALAAVFSVLTVPPQRSIPAPAPALVLSSAVPSLTDSAAFDLLPQLARKTVGSVRLHRYEWFGDGNFSLSGWAVDSDRVRTCVSDLETLPTVLSLSIVRSESAGNGVDFRIEGRAR